MLGLDLVDEGQFGDLVGDVVDFYLELLLLG